MNRKWNESSGGEALGRARLGRRKLVLTELEGRFRVATGGWQRYKTVSVGKIKIDQAGSLIIKLVPSKLKGFAVMNLRAVVLEPEAL